MMYDVSVKRSIPVLLFICLVIHTQNWRLVSCSVSRHNAMKSIIVVHYGITGYVPFECLPQH